MHSINLHWQKVKAAALILALLIGVSGCTLDLSQLQRTLEEEEQQNAEPMILVIPSEGITLAWEYPLPKESISSYKIAYAGLNGEVPVWEDLGTIPASDTPTMDVDSGMLPIGDWMIGIMAVDPEGQTSAWHSSLEKDSIPENGWIVRVE